MPNIVILKCITLSILSSFADGPFIRNENDWFWGSLGTVLYFYYVPIIKNT